MSTNDIGFAVYVSAALPATNTEVGFDALLWTKVPGVQSIGEFGVTHEGVDVPDLESGFTRQVKGAGSGVNTSMTFRRVQGDAGQAAIKAIADGADGVCAVKLIKLSAPPNPTVGDRVFYGQGIMHSYTIREKSVTSHDGFSVVFRNNALWLEEVEDI